MTDLTRVKFRPLDGGKEFVVYFDGEQRENQIENACTDLKAVVLFQQPSSQFEMLCEQISVLTETVP
jgi:hypothetical protein